MSLRTCLPWMGWSLSMDAVSRKKQNVFQNSQKSCSSPMAYYGLQTIRELQGFALIHIRAERKIKDDKWGAFSGTPWSEWKTESETEGDVRSERHRPGKKGKTWHVKPGMTARGQPVRQYRRGGGWEAGVEGGKEASSERDGRASCEW